MFLEVPVKNCIVGMLLTWPIIPQQLPCVFALLQLIVAQVEEVDRMSLLLSLLDAENWTTFLQQYSQNFKKQELSLYQQRAENFGIFSPLAFLQLVFISNRFHTGLQRCSSVLHCQRHKVKGIIKYCIHIHDQAFFLTIFFLFIYMQQLGWLPTLSKKIILGAKNNHFQFQKPLCGYY